jgi:enoyl-CoA hydratase/carnithine racemase
VRLTKRLLRYAQRMEFRDYLDVCAQAQGICHNTEDHLEAVSAFLEKRPPSFAGR